MRIIRDLLRTGTGLATSELSKSSPELLLYHKPVPELPLKPPLSSHDSRPCTKCVFESGRSGWQPVHAYGPTFQRHL